MPAPFPLEFRQRAVDLVRSTGRPVSQVAEELGISDSGLRAWVKKADRDDGVTADGTTAADRDELVRLRRELKVAKMEIEILRRAAAYFAKDQVPGPK